MAKKSNYNRKKELIGKSYVNGIKDEDGNYAIRPLNEEEKAFLEKFNEEFVTANFNKDKTDVHYPLIKKNRKEVRLLRQTLDKISQELRNDTSGWRDMNSVDRKAFRKKKKKLYLKKVAIEEKLQDFDIIGTANKNNYARGVDVSNYPKRTVKIADLEPANFIYTDEDGSYDTDSETSLFERLKVLN